MAKAKTATAPKADKVEGQPDSVMLSHPYGYIDEEGVHRQWGAGQVVTDPEQIADLIARQAPLVEAAE